MGTLPDNPDTVQPAQFARPGAIPLFLIHDGGGTTFSYHCLGNLDRPVFGIWNPHFYSGEVWPGGISEMARLYAHMIRSKASSPDFPSDGQAGRAWAPRDDRGRVKLLLGGWSLGGLLSLEVARLLTEDPAVAIVGMVFVDSVYPVRPPEVDDGRKRLAIGAMEPPAEGSTNAQVLAYRCMVMAGKMIREYVLPEVETWGSNVAEKNGDGVGRQTLNGKGGERLLERATMGQGGEGRTTRRSENGPPRTILVRASRYVPVFEPGISPVDIYRDDKMLGWGNYKAGFVQEVFEVNAHHFDIFALHNLDVATETIKRAFDALEMEARGW